MGRQCHWSCPAYTTTGRTTYIHTYTRLTALFPGLPGWAGTRNKGKTNLDFTEATDSEWQWHQLGHMQVCTSLQTDDHASTTPLSLYRPDALPATQPTASKHSRHLKNSWHWSERNYHHHHHHFICPIIQQYAHLHEHNSRRAGHQGPIWTLTAALKRSIKTVTGCVSYHTNKNITNEKN